MKRVVTTPNRTVRSPGSVYPEDIWEKPTRTPKTDYTYSHSGSYKPRSLHEGYISPNMSRRRLRGGAVNLTPTVKKPPSGAPFSGRSHHDDNMPVDNDRTRYDGSFLHPPSGNFNKRGNPRSATRSGTPYGAIWERDEKGRPRKRASTGIKPSPLKKNLDITNPAAYRQFEKELEYAGEASPYKESSLSHLYGLDFSDQELSEEEMPPKSQPKRKPQKSVAVDEQKTTWWTTIVTIITTIITSTSNMMWQSWVAAGSRIHRFLATTIVTDVWILHSTYTSGRRHGMCCCVPLLFILLIPLLLTGTYYMYDRGYASLPVSTVSKDSIHGQSIMGVNDRELASRVQKILVGLLRDREVDQNNQLHLYKQEVTVNQQQVFDTYKNDMEATFESLLAKVEARVDKLESNTAKSREEWLEHQQAVLASQKTDMEGLIAAMVERLVGAALAEQNAKIIALQKEGNAAAAAEQQEKLAAYRASMDTLLRDLIHQELGAFAAQAQGQDKEELAKQVTLQAEQGARIQEVSDQLSMVLAKADDLSNEIVAAKAGMQNQGEQDRNHTVIIVSKLEEQLAALRGNIEQLRASHAALLLQMKDCCKNDSAFAMLVKAGLQEEFAGMIGGAGSGNLAGMSMGGSGDGEKGSPFTNWLRDQFVKKDDIDAKMAVVAARLNDQIKSHAAEAVAAAAAAGGLAGGAGCSKCTGGTGAGIVLNTDGSGVSEEQVRMLIRDALIVFGADKTGMVDYAMESAGGSVLSTRCSETYHRRTAQLSLFGIPLWYASNSPRTVIQPDVNPGQCWAFRGSEGYIVVQLAGVVKPTAFTVEHIPKSLSPTGKIDSAPKMFSIWGLDHDRDREGIFIGNYTYQEEGEPLQYFPVSDPNIKAFPIVEMRIHSNWGNPEYTCLYRFRVHGVLKKW